MERTYTSKDLQELSPSDHIQKVRLFTAKQMLSISGTKIDGIVRKCGFSSISYLNRKFTEEYGFSPSQFQKYGQHKEIWNACNETPPDLI